MHWTVGDDREQRALSETLKRMLPFPEPYKDRARTT